MQDNHFKEVSIVIIACITLFLILAAVMLLILFIYQRRKFQQQQQLSELQLQFKEQSLRAEVEIQEQTFLAISQEIHDNVGQILSLARVQVNIMNETRRFDEAMLHNVSDNIGKALTDLRDLSRSLNSDRIKSNSIHDTLLQEAERINKTGIIGATVTVEGEIREMKPQQKLILFRILQESMQNCLKHADASMIAILFHYAKENIQVSVQDNGKGFDVAEVTAKGNGQGIENIKTRVRLTGGTSVIDSIPGRGTQITITIPYE